MKKKNSQKTSDNSGVVYGAASFAAGMAMNNINSAHAEELIVDVDPILDSAADDLSTDLADSDTLDVVDDGLQVAEVDDNLSFGAAFVAAREQVGAGGVFEWRGNVYGTYLKDEWDNMSADERHEWQQSVDYQHVHDVSEHEWSASQIHEHNTSHVQTQNEELSIDIDHDEQAFHQPDVEAFLENVIFDADDGMPDYMNDADMSGFV